MAVGLRNNSSIRTNIGIRCAIASVLLVFACTDPDSLGFQPEADDLIALGYFAAAIGHAMQLRSGWWRLERLIPVMLGLDAFVFLLLPFELVPGEGTYLLGSVLLGALIVLEAMEFWHKMAALWCAIAINCFVLAANHVPGFTHHNQPLGEDVRQTILLAAVSILIAISKWRPDPAILKPMATRLPSPRTSLLDDLLADAMDVTQAKGGAIYWRDSGHDEIVMLGQGLCMAKLSVARANLAAWHDTENYEPIIYNARINSALTRAVTGDVCMRPLTPDERALLTETCESDGLMVLLDGSSGFGVIILCGLPNLGRDDLPLAKSLGLKWTQNIDARKYEDARHTAALTKLRAAVARDLHDGVAQSLAGTSYWLKSLSADAAAVPDLASRLDRIGTAIKFEQEHLVNVIERLRVAPFSEDGVDLIPSLAELADKLALTWQLEVALLPGADSIIVPPQIIFDMQQIVREGVANAARHGKATRVELHCLVDGALRLTMRDNGTGFPADRPAATPRSINERVTMLGGALSIRCSAESTELECILPSGVLR